MKYSQMYREICFADENDGNALKINFIIRTLMGTGPL